VTGPIPSVEIQGVAKRYERPPTLAVDRLDLDLPGGSFTAVVGASGAGKSTLLRLIGGLEEATEGTISLGGMTPQEARRAKDVGWMAQHPALLPWRTVLDNIGLAQTINPRPGRETPTPEELVDMVGLSDFADAYPGALSGGMQQRVSLARTIAIGAPLWLMDEPFAALDELTRGNLADELLEVWSSVRPTVVWVTHHLIEAAKLADTIVLLTPRPGSVAGILDVDLARPRDETSVALQAIVRKARSILHQVDHPTLEAAG
jgi:NitT/TauT family transport system ATP-binding protein